MGNWSLDRWKLPLLFLNRLGSSRHPSTLPMWWCPPLIPAKWLSPLTPTIWHPPPSMESYQVLGFLMPIKWQKCLYVGNQLSKNKLQADNYTTHKFCQCIFQTTKMKRFTNFKTRQLTLFHLFLSASCNFVADMGGHWTTKKLGGTVVFGN